MWLNAALPSGFWLGLLVSTIVQGPLFLFILYKKLNWKMLTKEVGFYFDCWRNFEKLQVGWFWRWKGAVLILNLFSGCGTSQDKGPGNAAEHRCRKPNSKPWERKLRSVYSKLMCIIAHLSRDTKKRFALDLCNYNSLILSSSFQYL